MDTWLKAWIDTVGAIAFCLMMLFEPVPGEVVTKCEGAGIAPQMVRQAHRYHGILHSEVDEFGYRYFYRKGKKCRLFNKSFLEWRKRHGKSSVHHHR